MPGPAPEAKVTVMTQRDKNPSSLGFGKVTISMTKYITRQSEVNVMEKKCSQELRGGDCNARIRERPP